MRAVLKLAPGPGQLEVRELSKPDPLPDEIVVEVAACGICGTDLSLYQGSTAIVREVADIFPVVIGHEFTGVVEARGSAVRTLDEGDWVVVNPHLPCGRCQHCKRGEPEICDNRPLISWERPGGAADYVAVPAANAYRLDATVAKRVGVLAEPLAVAVHAVRRLGANPGDRVVVVGAGPIGILLALVVAETGADVTIVGLEIDRLRLAAAIHLGVRAGHLDGPGALHADGEADLVFEAAGTTEALRSAVSLVRKGGRVGVLGLPHHPVSLDLVHLVLAEKSLIGVRGYAPQDWDRTVEFLSRRVDALARLVTHRFSLGDVVDAMRLVESRDAVKVVLVPGKGPLAQ